jgi:hypothetical protein
MIAFIDYKMRKVFISLIILSLISLLSFAAEKSIQINSFLISTEGQKYNFTWDVSYSGSPSGIYTFTGYISSTPNIQNGITDETFLFNRICGHNPISNCNTKGQISFEYKQKSGNKVLWSDEITRKNIMSGTYYLIGIACVNKGLNDEICDTKISGKITLN